VVAERLPVEVLPLVAFAPLQPAEAVHEVALVELQVSVAEVPVPMIVGLAVSVTAGAAVVTGGVVDVLVAELPPPQEARKIAAASAANPAACARVCAICVCDVS
jgi:hypothetical protein